MKNKISLVSLFFSIFFFILGLWYPILSTKQKVLGFVLDYKEVRLFDSVKMFYESNEYFLAIIILVFTILLPIIKFLELLNREFKIIIFTKTISKILHALDKWAC
jgi:uncharacterized paraquat-inducible protein A